ncbi:hypothetical protein M3Y94_00026100 [Aphelenchoides besseyi]|nr:hypothetical protein M3Y94_00026100 [Aphelenchoides besseyi]KAI6217241.1 Asp-domain-containing protein [Aphelenchoides besseyi]
MLIGGLLMATTLVVFVDAGAWKLPIQEVKRVNRNNTLGPLHDVYRELLNFDRTHYRAAVYVGMPRMTFQVVIDTGSHILWVPKKGCKATGVGLIGNCKSGKYVYDPKGSASAEDLHEPFSIKYGSGESWVKGHYFKDVFSFGENMRLPEPITFGVGEEMNNRDQGILGLGNAINESELGSSIIHEAWRHKIIDAPIFTIYLRKCPDSEECEKHGTITIGSHDKEMCDKSVGRVNVVPDSTYWIFEVTSMQLGLARVFKPFNAITDSGAPGIFVPPDDYRHLMRTINAKRTESGYVVQCDIDIELRLFINGKYYVIPENQLLVNLHNGYCSLRIFAFNHPDGLWLLGTPFVLTYCMIHNIETHTVEFAPALTKHE